MNQAAWALGLHAGVPGLVVNVPLLRYTLLALGVVWLASTLRARSAVVVAAAIAFATVASGFWALGLGKPYGLFDDAETTRRAAELAIAEAAPAAGSFVAGEPRGLSVVWTALLAVGVPATKLVGLPTWLPLLTVPAVAAAVGLVWARREMALLAACLWLAFHTGALEGARAGGFLPNQWRQPEAALGFPVVVTLVLLASRLPLRPALRVVVGWLVLFVAVALGVLAGPESGVPWLARVWLATLDQSPWFWLALPALARASDPATLTLVSGGTMLTLLPGVSESVVLWAASALCRLGLLLASAETLVRIAGWARTALAHLVPCRLAALPAHRWALALSLATLLPGSFGVWWDPLRSDPVYERSTQPPSSSYRAPMEWIRSNTPPDAIFVASGMHAPVVAVLGGRRVLRAPGLGLAPDDARRIRVEGLLVRGKPLPDWAGAYPVHYVFAAAGDFEDRSLPGPEALEERPGFRLRYADRNRFRVYEVSSE